MIGGRGLLLPGDYLSTVCYPIVLSSVSAALASYDRLLCALDEWAISTVVPGHGPTLDRLKTQRVGRDDVDYLGRLQVAAADAVGLGVGAREAALRVQAVPPPRTARADFEALDLRSSNARIALAEAGHPESVRVG